jgi:hypothetical protein
LDQQDGLIAAAHAAASWARARRATWTSAPLPDAAAPPAAHVPDFVFVSAPADTPPPIHAAPAIEPVPDFIVPAAPPPLPGPDIPDITPAASVKLRLKLPAPALRWLARGAIALALVAAAVVGGRSLWNALPARPAQMAPVEPKPAGSGAATPATGSLHVSSTPAGAKVLVDGKARGVTPLELADLSPGRHEVMLQGDAGSVKRTVTVSANATATIEEAIFSGFVTVYAPFDVTVSEGGRVLRVDDRQQIMLPAGAHELHLTNRALDYDVVRRVDVTPGEATNVQLTPDPSALTVTSAEAAEVWLDGTRLGATPLNAAPVPLGVHEVLVRRAAGGERRFTVTIGTRPVALNAAF